jgi:hypothetical protein
MPYHIEVDLDSGVTFETWTGALTVEDVLECIETRHARADYDESTPRLVDISKAYGDLSADEVRKLADLHGSSAYRGKCAFVAPGDMQFGLSRLFEGTAGRARPVAVFRSKDDALDWLLFDRGN